MLRTTTKLLATRPGRRVSVVLTTIAVALTIAPAHAPARRTSQGADCQRSVTRGAKPRTGAHGERGGDAAVDAAAARHCVPASTRHPATQGIHKIKHIVVIMQENRSFDQYFGTFPGADGIPGLAGHPGKVPCIPDPNAHRCDKPYHDSNLTNAGGPHYQNSAIDDIDHGKMDGFVKTVEKVGDLDTDRL